MSAATPSSPDPAAALTLPLNRRRRARRAAFLIGLLLIVPVLAVIAVLALTRTLSLAYLFAPGFLAALSVPFGIAWIARPNRLPKADPVLDHTGIRLSADGRRLRRDVVLPWDRVRSLGIVLRTLTIEPVAWTDLAADDPADRKRWERRERNRNQTRRCLEYGLAKGLPGKVQLRDIVTDLSGGRVSLD
ncbi:hypothetical protein [Actinoplanes sp. NPDC049316]|uniref:hypothetical protein n=1 Tax=Actinoplanes sp. NPDC049316 TaxID=3154727 RepID=UPI0034156597